MTTRLDSAPSAQWPPLALTNHKNPCVIRTNELQVWLLAEHLVSAPLVTAL